MRHKLLLLFVFVREVFWIAVALAIVAGGVLGFQYLGETRPEPVAETPPRLNELVETQTLELFDAPLPIRGQGFVTPGRRIALSPRGSGRVTYVHPAIHQHGQFSAGEVLIRLEDDTERATLAQARANLEASRVRMQQVVDDLTRSEELLSRGVVSQTQVDQLIISRNELQANIDALVASIEIAEIALSERVIVAPFDGAVLRKSVEVGNVVSIGQELAEIFSDNELTIEVPVRQADAALIPALFEDGQASATVEIPFARYRFVWTGYVSRVEPQLDRVTRTLDVTVTLEELLDAMQGPLPASGAPPALINAFGEVVIDGITISGGYRIPVTALRNGNAIWLHVDGRLVIENVELVHVDQQFAFVRTEADLAGSSLITSAIASPVPGVSLGLAPRADQAGAPAERETES